MPQVIIALGSNCHQSAHIQWAAQRLARCLDDLRFSRRLWTADIHGSGAQYMNCLAIGVTFLNAERLQQELKAIESETGRTPGRVTIDLDLMLYDDLRYHERDGPRPYIQQLITDIQP
jgi:2-amino-4-hydroxy-6-hydroxymethyldihydropteridine diphosphokinase